MTSRSSFARALANLRPVVEADGVIDIVETAWLLRISRVYAEKGDKNAVALTDLLNRVREDGVVTPEESREILSILERIDSGAIELESYVKVIPDFPKKGVMFRDVTGIFENIDGFRMAIGLMEKALEGEPVDLVVAPESRGFIFGAALADRIGAAFAPVRKPGKLPRETVSEKYDLEYGQAELHLHKDAVIPGERVVVVDDLLATGGTALAAAHLVEKLRGQVVKMIFPIELEGFKARETLLKDYEVVSLIRYPGK